MRKLFVNLTTDTAEDQEVFYIPKFNDNRRPVLMAEGELGGAEVGLLAQAPGGTTWDTIDTSRIANTNTQNILNAGGFSVQGYLSGASGTTDVTLKLV